MGGNPRVLSAYCHLGNLIPQSHDRPDYKRDGSPFLNLDTKIQEKCLVGSPRPYWPNREDTKLRLRAIYDDLQVNDTGVEPWRWVRYPTEDGLKPSKAEIQDERILWLVEHLKYSRKEAAAVAEKEFFNFYNAEALDEQDPLGTLTEVNLFGIPFYPKPFDDNQTLIY